MIFPPKQNEVGIYKLIPKEYRNISTYQNTSLILNLLPLSHHQCQEEEFHILGTCRNLIYIYIHI